VLIREIARRTGLTRNMVKMYLRSDMSESRYPGRVSSSKLGPNAEKLEIEATKSRKQRHLLRQLHASFRQKNVFGRRIAFFDRDVSLNRVAQ
jgi:hypothetical protein